MICTALAPVPKVMGDLPMTVLPPPAHLDGRGNGGGGLNEADGQATIGGNRNHAGRAACGGADHTVVEAGPASAAGGCDIGHGVVERSGERARAGGAQLGQNERAVGAGRGRIQHARAAGEIGGSEQTPAVRLGGEITRKKGLLAHGVRWRSTGRSGERPSHSPGEIRRRRTAEYGSRIGGRQGEQSEQGDGQVTEHFHEVVQVNEKRSGWPPADEGETPSGAAEGP